MSQQSIEQLQRQIFELTQQLHELQKQSEPQPVASYSFASESGEVSLLELFGEHTTLLMIHNMGQGCRYCTLWADGFNGFLPHLESTMAVVLVSKDEPGLQRRFANERGWRFRMASHGGGDYIREQTVMQGADNMPGAVVYQRDGEQISRKNSCVFGPGDLFCSHWHLLALAGMGDEQWTPQYHYWQRPQQMDDGGRDLD